MSLFCQKSGNQKYMALIIITSLTIDQTVQPHSSKQAVSDDEPSHRLEGKTTCGLKGRKYSRSPILVCYREGRQPESRAVKAKGVKCKGA